VLVGRRLLGLLAAVGLMLRRRWRRGAVVVSRRLRRRWLLVLTVVMRVLRLRLCRRGRGEGCGRDQAKTANHSVSPL
jgi:hypothetical protein